MKDWSPKLCPIISSIGTFNYNLARFLYDLLSPLVPKDMNDNNELIIWINNMDKNMN